MFWRGFTTRGAQASMLTGTAASLLLIALSPTIQVELLGFESALFPLRNPGIISIPLSVLVAVGVSLMAPEPDAAGKFDALAKRAHLGV
jgi:cation/acetate symporter